MNRDELVNIVTVGTAALASAILFLTHRANIEPSKPPQGLRPGCDEEGDYDTAFKKVMDMAYTVGRNASQKPESDPREEADENETAVSPDIHLVTRGYSADQTTEE